MPQTLCASYRFTASQLQIHTSLLVISPVRLLVAPWTAAHQAPLFLWFTEARMLEWAVVGSSVIRKLDFSFVSRGGWKNTGAEKSFSCWLQYTLALRLPKWSPAPRTISIWYLPRSGFSWYLLGDLAAEYWRQGISPWTSSLGNSRGRFLTSFTTMALLLTLPSDEQRPCYFQRSLDVTGFPGGSAVENRLPIQETSVPPLDQEDPLEKEMANHSSIIAWGVPWAAEPGGLQSMQRDRHNWSSWVCTHIY